MTRPLRISFPDAVYHITSRGNAGACVFEDDADKQNFLFVLQSVVNRYSWLCHAYCLMGNHYHLLIETPLGNLSAGMRHLNGVYTQKCNVRHHRHGHIFQGRFHAVLVDKENYLLELCRYLALNPVRAGFVKEASDWKWSSYPACIGLVPMPHFLSSNWILSRFGSNFKIAGNKYKNFVHDGLKQGSPWKNTKGQILLGSNEFLKAIKKKFPSDAAIKEVPRTQRHALRPDLHSLFGRSVGKKEKSVLIYVAHVRYGYTLKEIAEYLKIHYTTVSKQLAGNLDKI